MKQVFTSSKGVVIKETIEPGLNRGTVKIRVAYSCISAGTEMTAVTGAHQSMIQRAIHNPDQVKKVIDIAMQQGLSKALGKVDSSMDKLGSSGYSIAGEVVAVGAGVDNFHVGDLVSAGGAGIALHAEYVVVPKNLVVHIPDGLNLAYASIGTVGSIAMHGVRRADLRLGEFGVVVGCGLMGLLAIQMMKASGVKVACTDVNASRLALAKELGADKVINSAEEDPVNAVRTWTNGYGADAVLFTAATHSDEPLSQSFKMCRRKGKVVLLGVSGMNINRADMYKDEIDFIISTSYGPGRYDSDYESKGVEYPYAYVRWTENRNIYSFLELIRDGKINIERIAPVVYPLEKAGEAYDSIKNDPGKHIITILDYGVKIGEIKKEEQQIILSGPLTTSKKVVTIGLIGAGSFATTTLLPIIADHSDKFHLKTIVNRSGDKALNAARQFKAEIISSEQEDIFNDSDVDLVMICTRHGNHAELVLKGLKAGKNVYVEKPLATTLEQLGEIKKFYDDNIGKPVPTLMVGFNRRFSKHAQEIKRLLDNRTAPVFIRYRMNAGFVPSEAWVHGDGGRIIGEGCHLIDLMQFLIDKPIADCNVAHFKPKAGNYLSEDNRFITIEFEDGSVAEIEYFACGSKALPKEYMEVHWEGKSIFMDDYKLLTGYGVKVKTLKSSLSRKGHEEEWLALYDALQQGKSPIDVNCMIRTTELSIACAEE
jgi:predicted dehydrogenase